MKPYGPKREYPVAAMALKMYLEALEQVYITYHGEKEVHRGTLSEHNTFAISGDNFSFIGSRVLTMYLPHINYNTVRATTLEVIKRELSFSRRVRLNKELNDKREG